MAVGLAMVNYNGADVLALTLDSLCRARVDTPFVVCLVDNGSTQEEYERARAAFDAYTRVRQHPGEELIRSETNLGFCGGSNLSAKTLLKNPEIDRVCFLNTDVIVSDGWLDRLMQSDAEVVGPVTNANGNEQTVWVDYEAPKNLDAFEMVNEFAAYRAKVFEGYEVASRCVTGFCSLIKRETLESVGLFDERFFPGGWDDVDYDRRVMDAGGRVAIRRDCYLHHWGGGSFSKLKMNTRIGISYANMIRYEEKWGTVWTGTQQLLPSSLMQDMEFMLRHGIREQRAMDLMAQTASALSDMLKNYESARIQADRTVYAEDIRREGSVSGAEERSAENQVKEMDTAANLKPVVFYPDPGLWDIIARGLGILSAGKHFLGSGARFLQVVYHRLRAPGRRRGAYAEALQFIREGRGTVGIIAPIFSEKNLKDGYFQRVQAVDHNVLAGYRKIYFFQDPEHPRTLERVDEDHLVVHFHPGDMSEAGALQMLMGECRAVYSHSVLRLWEAEFPQSVLNWLTKGHVRFIVDMHGAVPEESVMYDNWKGAQIYNSLEEIVMQGADAFICVNHAMKDHFLKKYSYMEIKPRPVVMPIFYGDDEEGDREILERKLAALDYSKKVVVYAGGLQLWQNVDLMQDLIEKRPEYRYDMMVPDPDAFLKSYGDRNRPAQMKVHAVAPEKVLEAYETCLFGFILRDDTTVNEVACPTKLIEYIRYGIVPVMKTGHMGDFVRYGMRYISMEDFAAGRLPDEEGYRQMVLDNARVLASFRKDYQDGCREVRSLIEGGGA